MEDPLKVLVIEDSPLISKVLTDTFIKLGYVCDQASTLHESRQKLKTKRYDLITLDIHLPDGEGDSLLEEFDTSDMNTQVVIYTADQSKFKRDHLFKYGILDYFVKDSTIVKTVYEIDRLYKRRLKNGENTVLVIDDSSTIRLTMQILLENRNYHVLQASTGKEGLEVLAKNSIDMVVLDLVLPDRDGSKILEKIKSNPKYIDLPVLILSGSEPSEVMSKVYKLGAADFVSKPFVFEELLLKVDFWVDYYRKAKELEAEQKLLKEYKDAVDRSNIVSKSDLQGRITFVNDAFCKISGYSKEEMIGKPHSIVRHSDMPSETFKDLWETISAKKPWFGIVKNRKKDGGHYYVDTAISPIVDYQGNIQEYIAVRKDITEMEEIRQKLQQELNATADSFEEAMVLSRQYELAINESNILSRTSVRGRIIYVNDEFCKVTGYSRDEIIGKAHNLFRHPDTPREMIVNLWDTIKAGRIWKGLIKNRKKSGEPYWVDSVILPIKNSKGEIIEYMAIRHDVTQILELHEEIEHTQRELIYRMGEVAESKSKETGNHIKRVALMSKLLAEKYGLDERESDILFTASPMHDVGKIAIPDAVLKKPGPLEDDEWEVMKGHAMVGYDILKGSDRPILKAAATISKEHHEKWDGSGYPEGLSGEDIHIYGRISAIADVFDALSSDRCYKKAWDMDRIVELFKEERGRHFDPKLVDILLDSLDEFAAIRESYKDSFE